MGKEKARYITISARDFIHEPYIECPKCKNLSFGVLSIFSNSYTRRCRECFYPKGEERRERFDLPKLKKKIIYLDQNVISNMMMALNPKTDAHKKNRVPFYWKTFFEKIDHLVKLQLIICPDSDFHRHESLLSPFYGALQRMYELLSHGVSFYDHETIHRFQISRQFHIWLGEKTNDLDIRSIIHGDLNAWQERFKISIRNKDWPELLEELRKNKEIVLKEIIPIFKRWQSEKDKKFDYWYQQESNAYSEQIINSYKRQLANIAMAYSGMAIEPGLLLPNMAVILIHEMRENLKGKGIDKSKADSMILEFLKSEQFHDTPYIKISSMLWASVARKAASGQRKPPNQGFMTDVKIISTLLPYCDAIFIDDLCRSYLMEKPLITEVKKFNTQVFSNSSRDDFFKYLDQIKSKVPSKHFEKIEEVYGPDWSKPFNSLYTYRDDQ